MDLTDEALIQNFRKTKDPAYFKSVVRRYEGRIYNAALCLVGTREEAEEVVQDTFVKLHQNIDSFRSHSSLAAWVFRIAHNACMDRLRTKQRRRFLQFWSLDSGGELDASDDPIQVVVQAPDGKPTPAEQLDASEQESLVEKSLRSLPESQRTVVILHDIEGFSYQEIAEIIGSNIGTVRSRLHYGRVRLRELLEPYFQFNSTTPAPR